MRATQLIQTFALCLSHTVWAMTGPQVAAYFQENLSSGSSVHLPSDSNYTTQVAQRWDIFAPPTYIVAVKPALPQDIQRVVRRSLAYKRLS